MNEFSFPSDILVRDIDQLNYNEWLQVRRSGIGGSDAAAALGLSKWKSPLELWEEKALGKSQSKQDSEPMRWGRLLEPVIREEFSRRTGFAVSVCRSMLRAPQWPWMQANLDGLIEIPGRGIGVFEVKTASAFKDSDWSGNDDSHPRCPDAYALQVAHYLAVTGLEYAVLCVLIGGNKLRIGSDGLLKQCLALRILTQSCGTDAFVVICYEWAGVSRIAQSDVKTP